MASEEEPIDVVLSAGELDGVVVALREFLHRSGALRVIAMTDTEPQAVVDCPRLAPVEISTPQRTVALPHGAELAAEPACTVAVTQLPPFEVDASAGEVASPLGGLEHYGRAVLALAAGLGGRSVAMATFETTDADTPLSLSARVGEPLVVTLGEEEFEMAPGWPQ